MVKGNNNFIEKSVFLGNSNDLKEFINKELKYPKEAILHKIEGKVYLKYKISPKGKVYDVIVTKGLGFGCDKEAIRIIKLLKYSVPKNRKIKVTTYKKLIINFKLPLLLDNQLTINYTIIK